MLTHDNVAVTFSQSTSSKAGNVFKYATDPTMTVNQQQVACGTQTQELDCSTLGSINESASKESSETPQTATPPTPTKLRKKSTPNMENKCRKYNVAYQTKMDDDYGSDWINCTCRNCIYWAHLYCLGFEVKDEDMDAFTNDMDAFTKVTKYYCPTHNPHTLPRPKSLAAKKL